MKTSALVGLITLAFAATTHAQTYRLTATGLLQGTSMNNAGQAVGYALQLGSVHASLYSNGTLSDIGAFNPTGINNLGQVSGYTNIGHMVIYKNGQITDLGVDPVYPGLPTYGLAINDGGEIVGSIGGSFSVNDFAAVTFSNGAFSIPTSDKIYGSSVPGAGVSVNNSGQIAGEYTQGTPGIGPGSSPTSGTPISIGWVYSNGVYQILNSLDGRGQTPDQNPNILPRPSTTVPAQINNSGVVTGAATDNTGTHAFILNPIAGSFSVAPSDISPAGAGWSEGLAINSQGRVTGFFNSQITYVYLNDPAPAGSRAFIFSKPATDASNCVSAAAASAAGDSFSVDLNTLINPSDPLAQYVTLIQGEAINDSGVILANGIDSRTGQTQAYIVTPNTGPAPLITTFAGGADWQAAPPLSMTTSSYRVTLGPDGAIYAVDNATSLTSSGSYVYRIDPVSGTITRIVGTGVSGYTGDGCPAGSATMNRPSGLVFDAQGNLYIADLGNNAVRKVAAPVSPSAPITSIPLTFSTGHSVSAPTALAIDRSGTQLYVAGTDSASNTSVSVVARIDVSGTTPSAPTLVTGNCVVGSCSATQNGAPAMTANIPVNALALDANNNLYLAPTNPPGGLVQIAATTQTLNVVTSLTQNGRYSCQTAGPLATSNTIIGDMAFEASGNLIIADAYSNLVCRATVDAATGEIDAGSMTSALNGAGLTLAQAPFGQPSAFDGGPVSKANFFGPLSGVAIDGNGDIFLAHMYRVHEILANPANTVTPNSIIRTVAGGYDGQVFSGDGNVATSATLGSANGLTVDAEGNVYIADPELIRRVDASTKRISTYAGDGYAPALSFSPTCGNVVPYAGDGGPATCAAAYPTALTVDQSGSLVFADSANRIRRIQNEILSTWVPAPSGLSSPKGLVVDASGNLYIADTNNNQVKMATPSGAISVLAGTGQKVTVVCTTSCPGDGSPAQTVNLSGPRGLALDYNGHLYFTDNNSVRMVNLATHLISTAYVFPPSDIAGNVYPAPGALCNSPSTGGCVHAPTGLARDAAGNLFVADAGNANQIIKLTPNATNTQYFATAITWGGPAVYEETPGAFFYFWYGGDGGAPINARVNNPGGLAVDTLGNLYIADTGNYRVRLITGVASAKGDFNGDGQVDSKDVALITAALNKPASGPNDPRELNHDGIINALDARILVTLCTHPGCAID